MSVANSEKSLISLTLSDLQKGGKFMCDVTTNYLRDDFEVAGNDAEEFVEWCNAVDNHTTQQRKLLEEMTVLSVKPEAREVSEITYTFPCWVFDASDPVNNGVFKEEDVDISGYILSGNGFLTDEAYENGLMMRDGSSEVYTASLNVFNTLAQRIDCDGKTMSHNNVGRNLLLAERMGDLKKPATLIFKEAEGIRKLFAVMSGKYAHVPLETISGIVERLSQPNTLGVAECNHWSVDHKRAEIDLSFPEYAAYVSNTYGLKREMIPSIKLMTSDIGECSFIADAYWKVDGSVISDAHFAKEHKGNLTAEAIYEAVTENIFDRYTVLPEKLVELMKITMGRPADLTKEEGREDNRAFLLACYKVILSQLKYEEILGNHRYEELIDCINLTCIDDSQKYTAYDLCMDILELPEQLQTYLSDQPMGETMYKKLQTVTSKAAYLDFIQIWEKAARMTGKPAVFLANPAQKAA